MLCVINEKKFDNWSTTVPLILWIKNQTHHFPYHELHLAGTFYNNLLLILQRNVQIEFQYICILWKYIIQSGSVSIRRIAWTERIEIFSFAYKYPNNVVENFTYHRHDKMTYECVCVTINITNNNNSIESDLKFHRRSSGAVSQ